MGIEIERKFLVTGEAWRSLGPKTLYRQGYLPSPDQTKVRVRIIDEQAYLTIKGQNTGLSRLEFEYEIPLTDAQALLESLCQSPLIEKYRYRIAWQGFIWEVDEFLGDNAGLILAEVELESETQNPPLPDWLGVEVTHDPRYYNSNLARHPFRAWL